MASFIRDARTGRFITKARKSQLEQLLNNYNRRKLLESAKMVPALRVNVTEEDKGENTSGIMVGLVAAQESLSTVTASIVPLLDSIAADQVADGSTRPATIPAENSIDLTVAGTLCEVAMQGETLHASPVTNGDDERCLTSEKTLACSAANFEVEMENLRGIKQEVSDDADEMGFSVTLEVKEDDEPLTEFGNVIRGHLDAGEVVDNPAVIPDVEGPVEIKQEKGPAPDQDGDEIRGEVDVEVRVKLEIEDEERTTCNKEIKGEAETDEVESNKDERKQKPFTCDTCGIGFNRERYLKLHKIRLHKGQGHRFTRIGSRSADSAEIYTGETSYYDPKSYLCSHCPKRFKSESEMRVHTRRRHDPRFQTDRMFRLYREIQEKVTI